MVLIVIIIIFFKVLGLVKTEDMVIGLFDENWRAERQKKDCALQEENLMQDFSAVVYYLPPNTSYLGH